jgi:hypothetical protein
MWLLWRTHQVPLVPIHEVRLSKGFWSKARERLAAAGALIEPELHTGDLEQAKQRWQYLVPELSHERQIREMMASPEWPEIEAGFKRCELAVAPDSAGERRLTTAEFKHLAAVPAAVEWFANIDYPRTRRVYQGDLEDFCSFVGLSATEGVRAVMRSHVQAWRAQLEQRGFAGATIRRKLAALTSLFDHLLESNAVAGGNARKTTPPV